MSRKPELLVKQNWWNRKRKRKEIKTGNLEAQNWQDENTFYSNKFLFKILWDFWRFLKIPWDFWEFFSWELLGTLWHVPGFFSTFWSGWRIFVNVSDIIRCSRMLGKEGRVRDKSLRTWWTFIDARWRHAFVWRRHNNVDHVSIHQQKQQMWRQRSIRITGTHPPSIDRFVKRSNNSIILNCIQFDSFRFDWLIEFSICLSFCEIC